MKNTAYLQFVIDGIGEPLFDFANTEDGQKMVQMAKKYMFIRDNQIKEILVGYTCSYVIKLAINVLGLPDTKESLMEFYDSDDFGIVYRDIIKTVDDNYIDIMNCLNGKDKKKLNALFD